MKSSQIYSGLVITLFIVGILAGCTNNATSKHIEVGGVFALTGFASAWGEAGLNATQMAIDEANESGGIDGKQIKLIVEDAGSSNPKMISAVRKLISVDQVPVVLGLTWLDSFGGATPIFDQEKVLGFSSAASATVTQSPGPFEYVFTTWYRSDKQAYQFAKYLGSTEKKNIAVMMTNDAFLKEFIKFFKIGAEESGVSLPHEYWFSPEENDFKTALTKVEKENVDGVIIGFSSENAFHNFLKQRRELAPDLEIYGSEYLEEFVEKEEFIGLWDKTTLIIPPGMDPTFKESYRKKFGKDPIFCAPNAYDAAKITISALKEGHTTPDDIKNYLEKGTFESVAFEEIQFDDLRGVTEGTFSIKTVNNGSIEVRKL